MRQIAKAPRPVRFIGAGPGALCHLTLGAAEALRAAEIVIHDRLVGPDILGLIHANAEVIDMGKEGFGPSAAQTAINATLVAKALTGRAVVRLKGGDCGIFGRLDEEIEALEPHGIPFEILPGLTAATVAAASIGQSLTRRGRNKALRILTGHDMAGFADQDWRGLSNEGEVAAIYMGKKSARFLQGRLMMHGASPTTPVTIVENVSRPEERIIGTTLATLPTALHGVDGPAVLLYGLAPRHAARSLEHLPADRIQEALA